VIGPIAFDDKGDIKNGPITIYVVKGGKWEALETITPGDATATASAGGASASASATAAASAPDAAKK
jgi:branched-chain amino acid transport system substrate-binding protein